MALKDWKKVRNWKSGMTFEKKERPIPIGNYIQVYKDNSFNPSWRTTRHSKGKFVEDKLSKTREEALKFAKSYMRRH
jgi:hypothetical protein